MLASSRERLLAMLAPDAVVLDVGGWADPLERADWVIDLMPYETRGLYERERWVAPRARSRERFTRETWIQRDVCDREPLPFADDEIDFVVCSHTLEDLRDPVWVCSELARVGKAGYIEVPSRLEEQSIGVEGAAFAGWSHHRWLVEIRGGGLELMAKPYSLHSSPGQCFPHDFWSSLREEERVQTLWWEGSFACRERIILDPRESEEYLAGFVAREMAARGGAPEAPAKGRSRRSLTRRIGARLRRPDMDGWNPGEPWSSAVGASLVTPLKLFFLHELTDRLGRLGIEGDIVECGVYRGGSAAVLGWAMMRLAQPRKLWLFDSFGGMPPAGEHDGEFSHRLQGRYVGSRQQTRDILTRVGVPPDRFEIVEGLYEEVYPALDPPPTALLHVDCDLYESVKLSLEKFFPVLAEGGYVVLNDYGIYKGAKEATDEFLAASGLDVELVAIDPTAAFFQKPGVGFSGSPAAGHYPGWPGAIA